MAETDTRLEALEDEVKVLKGEVKRTLVDLRAFLMREDSPLGDGTAANRMAMQQAIPANEAAGPAAVTPPTAMVGAGTGELPGPAPQQAVPGPGPGAPPQAMANGQIPSAPSADNPAAVPQAEGMSEDLEKEDHQDALVEKALEEEEPVRDLLPPGPGSRSRVDSKGGREKKSNLGQDARKQAAPGEKGSDSRGKSERVTSIYDEYRDLLEETKLTHYIEDEPVGPPLDVNLMANLVYWASLAKQRVGEAQLKDLLQLYVQSGHSRPELQDLVSHICKMVDVEAAVIEENGSDWVDLMFHLHGILTGGFPVMKIPYIRLPAEEEVQGGES